ncbi:hypothetical protein [Allokutzneria oryzae]|uniref:Uncharacterized protein n=1 Tax=Allokutzneria oryzae TaxID=1378989 RepID=A0ABV5ZWM7_9PSEU
MAENFLDRNLQSVHDNAFPGWSKFGENVATNLPGPLGSAAKLIKGGATYGKDGTQAADFAAIIGDASSLITSCAGMAASLRVDPLGFLINQGLSFLINVCTPIKQAIDLVSGNPDALSASATKLHEVSKDLLALSKDFSTALDEELKDWDGATAEKARERLRDFDIAVQGVAGQNGDVATVLQCNSMVMKIAEDFLKGLLVDLVEWLIVTWIAAVASAPVTLGGSTAVAGSLTAAKAGQKAIEASALVKRLQKFLGLNTKFMQNIRSKLSGSEWERKFLTEGTGKAAKAASGLGGALRESVAGQGKKLVGMDKTKVWEETGKADEKVEYTDPLKIASKAAGYAKGVYLAAKYGTEGEDVSNAEMKKGLDI